MSGLRPLRRRVEHVDTDAAGVVHFTRYASLIETALLENLEELGVGTHLLSARALEPAVTELRMTYRAAARFPDLLVVRVDVDHVAGETCGVSGTVHRVENGAAGGETLLATGGLVLGVVRAGDGAPAVLPDTFRAALRARMEDR
ncbi:thioesterase family protein [Spongiactinospora sp. TRM90649]|uniref:acyl-CoA thioesterase n=1 Tax=Spongiactinospora sp. TRM90649 TaxID=3031114 RepID=UPI0023F85C5A|nr:thioesterase family protein [Spongiactinospora sp. TRM90649]MDF5755758.1 hotdog domain-containing protein [Spongiactinospora sp. TRM90649]